MVITIGSNQGFKLKMDDVGNILIKRLSKTGVRVLNTNEESAVSNDILKLQGGMLEVEKPAKVRKDSECTSLYFFPVLLGGGRHHFFLVVTYVNWRKNLRANNGL